MQKLNKNTQKKIWIAPNISILNINQTKSGNKNGKENQGNVDGNNSNSRLL